MKHTANGGRAGVYLNYRKEEGESGDTRKTDREWGKEGVWKESARGGSIGWGWLHYSSILDAGSSILAGGTGPASSVQNSWAPLYQKDRQGLERVLRGGHITADSTWWGGAPSAQVFLRLPLLALEGRLHHPHPSSVAGFSISNSCSLEH